MSEHDVIEALVAHQGKLYSEEIGADISRDTPQELFHWLIAALMMSARISAGNALRAAAALRAAGLHKTGAIRAAHRTELVRVLNENGYARYDESTADYIKAAAELVEERYGGDLRRLRDDAGDGAAIRRKLQEFKGIGAVGADIFAREAQLVWDALYPVTGRPAREAAKNFGLPEEPGKLAEMAGSRERFVRLVAALTRAALEGPADEVSAVA